MNTAQLNQKLARLEFVQDQLESELSDLDTLLKSIGFPQGLASAKEVALEMIENEDESIPNEPIADHQELDSLDDE